MSHGNNPPPPPSANPAIQAVNEKTAFEKAAEDRLNKFTTWENSAGPHDILDAPGMSDMVDIYGSAESLANQKRLSNPAVALSGGGSGDYAAQLDSLGKQNRYDDRAAGLSRGLQSAKAEAYGLGGSAAELESNRKQAYASDMLNQENAYYNRPRKQPLWEKIAGIAIGGLGAAGGVKGLAAI
jgi:hypothetical protein